jgi:tetratricopeptide (TPR) repeat protein
LPELTNNRGIAKSQLIEEQDQDEIADYDRAISLDPNLTEAYYNRGVAKSELGDMIGAIADYDRAIGLNPADADAYCNRGVLYEALGKIPAAISDLDRSAQLFWQQGQIDLHDRAIYLSEQLNANC